MAINWVLFENQLKTTLYDKKSTDFSDFSEKFVDIFTKNTLNIAQTPFGNLLINGNYQILKKNIENFLFFNYKIQEIQTSISITLEDIKSSLKDNPKSGQINIEDISSIKQNAILYTIISSYIKDFNKKVQENQENIVEYINQFESKIETLDVKTLPYLYLEIAFINFWITAKFSDFPAPPPLITPLFGVSILTPGIPGILSLNFKLAFTSSDNIAAASILTKGLKLHTSTISGVYSGFVATPAGPVVSPPVPWIGVV
jgi:hypothetical protein